MLGNGILRMYNQFPYCYSSIDEMTKQLHKIKEMGFNAVWVNPMQETGKLNVVREFNTSHLPTVTNGSIYAMRDHRNLNSKFGESTELDAQLKNYTKTARELGMMPIFDLVLNHVAKDSPLVSGTDEQFVEMGIDTSKWFIEDPLWDDAAKFNYKDEQVKREIIDYLWKPYMEKYIAEYGFQGARIDAARLIPKDVQKELYAYMKELCEEYHPGVEPIIFTEILYSGKKPYSEITLEHAGIGITHTTNNAYWAKQTDEAMRNWKSYNDKPGEYDDKKGLAQQIVHLDDRKEVNPKAKGGTVGFPASHDEETLVVTVLWEEAQSEVPYISHEEWHERKQAFLDKTEAIKREHAEIITTNPEKIDKRINEHSEFEKAIKYMEVADPLVVERGMRQRIATAALTSDGGFFLLSGDEYGDPRKKNVFDIHDMTGYSWETQWEGKYNLEGFVQQINATLEKLPAVKFPHWTEVMTLPSQPDLFVAIRHNGPGFSGETDMVLVNLNPKSELKLTERDLEQIKLNSASKAADSYHAAYSCCHNAQVHVVGKITAPGLKSEMESRETSRAGQLLQSHLGKRKGKENVTPTVPKKKPALTHHKQTAMSKKSVSEDDRKETDKLDDIVAKAKKKDFRGGG